jgi:hypothetical protein
VSAVVTAAMRSILASSRTDGSRLYLPGRLAPGQ